MPVFAADELSLFLEAFGENATYKHGATTTPVRASFDEGKWLGKGGDMGEDADEPMRPGMANYTVIFIGQNELPSRPAYQDRVVRADGSEFTVLQVRNEDGMWKIWASSDERMDF